MHRLLQMLETLERFSKRGLDLIQGTQYAKDNPGDLHKALADAIADRALKTPKNASLISWVKQFWTRVGKMLKLTISPEALQELTVDQYLNIAATQLRYGNDIYADLVADGAQVSDTVKPAGPNPEGGAKAAERKKSIEDKFDADMDAYLAAKPAPNGAAVHAAKPKEAIAHDKHFEFTSRDLNAKGQVFTGKNERLLRVYSGDKKKLIESVHLLMPTLKSAGISLTYHENPDSYYNAVVSHGGSEFQATESGGFYTWQNRISRPTQPCMKHSIPLSGRYWSMTSRPSRGS